MVDISTIFLVYEYLKKLLGVKSLVESMTAVWVSLGITVVFFLLSFIVRRPKDDGKVGARTVFRFISIVFAVLTLAFYLRQPESLLKDWTNQRFGISGDETVFYLVCALIFIVTVICFVISRFASTEPDNTSVLNVRQKCNFVTFLGVFALVVAVIWFFRPNAVSRGTIWVLTGLEVISIIFWFYDPIIYIISRIRRSKLKNPPVEPTPGKLNSFAIIGCAHNEEAVIGNLVKSLYRTTYPRDKYDVFVICDNCTDGTADAVREAGAIAMERHDPDRRGKGYGLEWMFAILEQKRKEGKEYDAYIVLDADNVVNEAYLDEVNLSLNEGHEIMQTYLGCKNPRDTWISKCYSMAYWLSNANFQDAHSRVGLSCQMGGTGMVVRPSVLDEVGWRTDSLTEDLILTSRYVIKKNKVCYWVHDARLYDEKPLRLKPSMKQRTRWMQGHMNAMELYAPKMLIQGIKNFSWKQIDICFYLCRPMLNLIMFSAYLVRLFGSVLFPLSVLNRAYIMSFDTATLLLITYFLMQFYVLYEEQLLRYAFWIPLQWVFTYSWYLPFLRGFIKRNEKFWVSTVHERAMDITEILEDADLVEAKHMLEGLDNLYRLPLGQMLLKATVITKQELEEALEYQKKNGGFLGDTIVKLGFLSQNTLNAYLNLSQEARAQESVNVAKEVRPQIGEILVSAKIINEEQLKEALDYQKLTGKRLGECLVELKRISESLVDTFLMVQKVLIANYVEAGKAFDMIEGVTGLKTDGIEVLLACGLITRQQLAIVDGQQAERGGTREELLVLNGYVEQEAIDMVESLRNFFEEQTATS